jgi:hypothetical protein
MEADPEISLGPKMLACTPKERRFVFAYVNGLGASLKKTEAGTQAARAAGYSDVAGGAKVRAFELLHRERVLEAIAEVCAKEFRALAPAAIWAIKERLADSRKPDLQLKAGFGVLSRLGYAETTNTVVDLNLNVELNHTEAAVEDLRRLKALGFSKEQLEKFFGFSGYSRYAALLDGQAPKVVEHIPTTGSIEPTAPESKPPEKADAE